MNLNKKEYNLKKSVNRLSWRFKKVDGNYKSFTPNETDIEAVNCLINWINRSKYKSIERNDLFAKLFIYQLNKQIEHFNYDKNIHPDKYKGYISFLDTEPEKSLCRILEMPLNSFYLAFLDKINNDWHHYLINNLKNIDLNKQKIEKYTLDRVKLELNHKITEALNRF